MSEPIRMWRCEACGKWSHAKRRPTSHKVAILTDHDYGTDVIGYRKCGPLAEYVASRVGQTT